MTRYEPVEQQTFTRNGRNGVPYTIHEPRYLPSNSDGPRSGSRGYQDTSEQENDDVNKQNQRRRIPIACGRCRKRKIRCSGPQGDSGCQNCKTAGNDMCHFNRVQAQELYFAEHLSSMSSFGTSLMHLPTRAASTQFCEVTSPTYGLMPHPSSSRMFRNPSLEYPRPGTYSSFGGSYGEYPEETGYNTMAYPAPPIHSATLEMYESGSLHAPPQPRSFTPAPPLKNQHSSIYELPESYPQQQHQSHPQQLSHYGGSVLPLRSSIGSSDSQNAYSFQNMAQTLPPSERALPALPAPMPTPRSATRYDSAIMYGNTVPSSAASTSLVPSQPFQPPLKSNSTSSHLANNGAYMSHISASPDGTMTSNSSFNSADTGTSSNDMYGSSNEWQNEDIHNTSATHSAIPQQQHQQLPSQSHAQMTSLPLDPRRSDPDLHNENGYDNYNHNASAHTSNSSHPYNLNNSSVQSLHGTGSVSLSSSIQDTVSGDVTPQPPASQHPQARKLSHHHSTPFLATSDTSLSSLPSSSGIAGSVDTAGYSNTSLSVSGHIAGDNPRPLGSTSLSSGQGYESQGYRPWVSSAPPRQEALGQGMGMSMGRNLDDDIVHGRSISQGLSSGVRV